jgi:hypothetical protein
MAEFEVEGEWVTDVDTFLRTWNDQKYCKCGAKLTKLQLKCNNCVNAKRREYLKENAKKRRKVSIDAGQG